MRNRFFRLLLIILFGFFRAGFAPGQAKSDSIPISEAILKIQASSDTRIFFRQEWLKGKNVLMKPFQNDVEKDLKSILEGSGYSFYNYHGAFLVIYKSNKAGDGSLKIRDNLKSNIRYILDGRVIS